MFSWKKLFTNCFAAVPRFDTLSEYFLGFGCSSSSVFEDRLGIAGTRCDWYGCGVCLVSPAVLGRGFAGDGVRLKTPAR